MRWEEGKALKRLDKGRKKDSRLKRAITKVPAGALELAAAQNNIII